MKPFAKTVNLKRKGRSKLIKIVISIFISCVCRNILPFSVELQCKTPDCMKTFCSKVNVGTVFYCHEPLVSSSGRTGSMDVKVKEEGTIPGLRALGKCKSKVKYCAENIQV